MRRRLATLFLLLAVVTVIVAAVRWRTTGAEIAAQSAQRDALESRLDTTRTSLHKASLRYQGFEKGMDAIPDSVRMATAGATMQQSNIYRKNIIQLEGEERRIGVAIKKIDARIARSVSGRRRLVLPLAALATVLFAGGAVLLASERARRVAP